NTSTKSLSFEFFPPKREDQEPLFFETIGKLKEFNPSFVSVTYGAMGSNQEKSFEMVSKIRKDFDLTVLAHFTCIGTSTDNIRGYLDRLLSVGIDNVLALRGDIPEDLNKKDVLHDFNYAADLVRFIKENYGREKFSIGVAGYPEGHPECDDLKQDLYFLKDKVDAGADYIITQLFFDNSKFYKFRDNAMKTGINVPILAGIMPIVSYKMIEKITQMCGCFIPEEILSFFNRNDISLEEQEKYAIDYMLKQCVDLKKNGVNNFHFYTLNKSGVVYDVCKKIVVSE
ncbi:methylenetetrahydrofolate reductase [NAD(P)H], partial [bacterium]|nr:methylenetetrahydrofolate reductase [NAD(P)H] [bacterium]